MQSGSPSSQVCSGFGAWLVSRDGRRGCSPLLLSCSQPMWMTAHSLHTSRMATV